VIIESGPLAAVDAIFDRELDDSTRVEILVRLMGRNVTVRIDRDHIRSIAS
jgi:transcription antitermination factor NusG